MVLDVNEAISLLVMTGSDRKGYTLSRHMREYLKCFERVFEMFLSTCLYKVTGSDWAYP